MTSSLPSLLNNSLNNNSSCRNRWHQSASTQQLMTFLRCIGLGFTKDVHDRLRGSDNGRAFCFLFCFLFLLLEKSCLVFLFYSALLCPALPCFLTTSKNLCYSFPALLFFLFSGSLFTVSVFVLPRTLFSPLLL